MRADGQPPETAEMARRAKGRYLAGKVRMKIVTLELGLSWLKVYAREMMSAFMSATPPRK